MQAGCGLQVRRIKGRWYVYFWHYNGPRRGRQSVVYCGRAGTPKARDRALRLLLEHEGKAKEALDRRLERYRAALERHSAV